MTTHTRRAIRAALLSLVIAASFLTTGGWFCADGRACLPALSPSCCCGGEDAGASPASRAVELCDDAACGDCLSAQECGCYRELPALASLPTVARVDLAELALQPASAMETPKPSTLPALCPPGVDPSPPPRFLVSCTGTRGPPAG